MTLLRLLLQTVGLALSQIWVNKVRAMLTTLGIIIAVAAITAVAAAGEGFKKYMLDQFATFGANKVWIFPDRPDDHRERYSWRQIRIKESEVDGMLAAAPSLKRISPIMSMSVRIQYDDRVRDFVSVQGIWPDWHEIEQRFVTVGRTFTSIDEEEALNVCLLNDKGLQELKLPNDPTGKVILLDGRRFTIVGVVETKTPSALFGNPNDTQLEVYIPFSTGTMMRPEPRMYVVGQTRGPNLFEDVKAEVRAYLRRVRGLGPDEPNTFGVEAIDQVISQFNRISTVISLFLGGVVGISLLVGGIGIMNIMLVSVSERTHEIGLRKAVGARPGVILTQFLVEAVVLCMVGCGVGLVIGLAVVLAFRNVVEQLSVPAWAPILAVSFSAATGIIFGMFPAIKAARLDPIAALRHE